ncbi:MAG: hypothetical protein VB035_06195 [Candidatus Fimivivens sp.]|nr:hypothetical protein [Candidatus Fimivivens sp.]
MTITINTGEMSTPNWRAAGAARVVQNVKNLLSVGRYEVVLDRTLGIDPNVVDMPMPQAQAAFAAEVTALLERSEPRAQLVSATCVGASADGQLIFEVVLNIVY